MSNGTLVLLVIGRLIAGLGWGVTHSHTCETGRGKKHNTLPVCEFSCTLTEEATYSSAARRTQDAVVRDPSSDGLSTVTGKL